jgi:hypothetical protein
MFGLFFNELKQRAAIVADVNSPGAIGCMPCFHMDRKVCLLPRT